MKRVLLIIIAVCTVSISASAYDKNSFDSYLIYAERIAEANRDHEGYEALEVAVIEAEDLLESGGDFDAELLKLKSAVNTFFKTATGDAPVYVEYSGKPGSVDTWIDYGWTFGYTGSSGSNGWNFKNRSSDCGNSVEKWGSSTEINFASETIFDLPAGSYTINITAGGDADIAKAVISANSGEAEELDLSGAVTERKARFYFNSNIDSLQITITDLPECSGWVAFTDVYIQYSGEDALAPYRAAMNAAIEQAKAQADKMEEDVTAPHGVIETLRSLYGSYENVAYSTQAEYEAATAAINDAIQSAKDAESSFTDFINTGITASTILDTATGEAAQALQEVLTAQTQAANNAKTNDDIVTALNALNEAIRNYQYSIASEDNPVEIFNSGEIYSFNGWITGGTATANNGNNEWYISTRTSAPTGNVMEMWGGKSANYAKREITNAPEGLYELSVFIANSATCQLYFNGETSDIEVNESGATASKEFYMADPAEVLQFGVQSTTATWVAFNNMVLEYKGKDAQAAKRAEFQQKLQDAGDYIATLDGMLPKAILDNANDQLMEMDQDYDSVEEYQEAINKIAELIESVDACKDAFASAKELADTIQSLLDNHKNLPDADTWNNTNTQLSEVKDGLDKCESIEDIAATILIESLLYTEYGMAIASEEEPFCYTSSGDADDFDDWITGGTSESNNGNNLWYVTTRTSAPTGKFYEMWGSSATNYAYLEENLPAGLYKMEVNMASSEACEFYFNGATSPITASLEGAVVESEYFAIDENKTVQYGVQSTTANWVCFNNLKLYYCGKEIPEGINSVIGTRDIGDKDMFNLAGQKVDKAYKGIIIQNGRKVLQK